MVIEKKQKGFGLVETLVGIAVFLIISLATYNGFAKLVEGLQLLRIKNLAMQIANEQIEIIRNIPYADVGIVNGLPAGKIPHEKIVTRDDSNFYVLTTIRNIDDPFDGLIGGSPNDLSPADYKLAEISVRCHDCKFDKEMVVTGRIAPKNLETQGNNGALFVQVIDSSGQPVVEADVVITNVATSTPIVIEDVTNNLGLLQLVDAPPGVNAYNIAVSKENYSNDKTYAIGSSENPVPDNAHTDANVIAGKVTQMTFAIDELSDLNIFSKFDNCGQVANLDFNMKGSKTIGLDTFKYDQNLSTESDGGLFLEGIEWDNYFFELNDDGFDLVGTNPFFPVDVQPNSDQSIDIIVRDKSPRALSIAVRDASSGLPLSDAEVTLTKGTITKKLISGKGFFYQTDWSGGSGQEIFSDISRYFSSDGGIDYNIIPGEIRLVRNEETYTNSGWLTSSIYDTSTTTNFHTISWMPFDQPISAGPESVKFQIATNVELTPTSTWSYKGPDGSSSSFYTSPGTSVADIHDGGRYIRYKAYLSTQDNTITPSISDISITYSTNCAPPGQVMFNSLSSGTYTVSVSKEGYQTSSSEINLDQDWQRIEIELSP